MNLTRSLKVGLLFVLTACMQGCFPSFDHPVVELSSAARDDRLLGLWEADMDYFKDMEKGDCGFLLFLPCDAGYCITMYTVEEGRGDAVHLTGYAQVIDSIGYLNYQYYEVDSQEEGHHLLQYQLLADGNLVLNLVDNKKLEEAIAAGTIAGTVSEEPDTFWSVKDVRVSSSREELLRFLKEHDIFTSQPFGVFRQTPDAMVEKVKKALWETSAGPAAEPAK